MIVRKTVITMIIVRKAIATIVIVRKTITTAIIVRKTITTRTTTVVIVSRNRPRAMKDSVAARARVRVSNYFFKGEPPVNWLRSTKLSEDLLCTCFICLPVTPLWDYRSPAEQKFRSVKKSNKKIQSAFCDQYGQVLPAIMTMLKGCGFKDHPDVLVCDAQDLEVLSATADLLEALAMSVAPVH